VAASSAAVYIVLDCRTDLGYQILGLAIHERGQSQYIAADHQAQNLGGNQARTPVSLVRGQIVSAQYAANHLQSEELAD
jgi:hypothetical protein